MCTARTTVQRKVPEAPRALSLGATGAPKDVVGDDERRIDATRRTRRFDACAVLVGGPSREVGEEFAP